MHNIQWRKQGAQATSDLKFQLKIALRTQENNSNCCHQISYFKATTAPNLILAGALPQTLLVEFTTLPQVPSKNLGVLLLKKRTRGGWGRKGKEGKGEGKKEKGKGES